MKFKLLLLLPILFLLSGQVLAQTTVIKQTETHSVFKGFFLSVWSKLRAINPHQKQTGRSSVVYTAGIRGAEATETLIKPYWKDDLSQNEAFQKELKQFSNAQQLMDKGDLQASAKSFDDFILNYANSSLLPNALFAKSISYAGLGNTAEATSAMQKFIDTNPNHPLISDAKQVIEQLK